MNVQDAKRSREGVAIFVNNVCYIAVVDYGCVCSGMMDSVVDIVNNGDRFCVLGDLNGWVGDEVRMTVNICKEPVRKH